MASGPMTPRENVKRLMAQLAVDWSSYSHWMNDYNKRREVNIAVIDLSMEQYQNFMVNSDLSQISPEILQKIVAAVNSVQEESRRLAVIMNLCKTFLERVCSTKLLLKQALMEVKGQNPPNWIHFFGHGGTNFVLESETSGMSFSNASDSTQLSIFQKDFYIEVGPANPKLFQITRADNIIRLVLKYNGGGIQVIQVMTDDLGKMNNVKVGRNRLTGNVFIECLTKTSEI